MTPPLHQCPSCKQGVGILGRAMHWLFGCSRSWVGWTDSRTAFYVTVDGKTREATPEEAAEIREALDGVRAGMDQVSRAMDGLGRKR